MDFIFYYSNYCKHSKEVIQFLTKNGLIDKMNCICIDKRYRDPKTGTMNILMENGRTVILPVNVTNVPSLLQIKNNFTVLVGEDIIKHFQPKVQSQMEIATGFQHEPSHFSFHDAGSVVSEKYTYYNMTSDELSAKGYGKNRQMHNYLDANHNPTMLNLPPETYKKEKMSEQITIDFLQKKRDEDSIIQQSNTAGLYGGRL